MNPLGRLLVPPLLAAFTSPRSRNARRWLNEAARRLRREPRRVAYFHQVDDPYSHLAAQRLQELTQRYDLQLETHLVGPPADDAAPEPDRLREFACKDAADVAPGYGLSFPRDARPPDDTRLSLASRLLAATLPGDRFATTAARIGEALWAKDANALEALGRELPAAEPQQVEAAVASGDALRRRLGHYLGATFHHAGEWYWGVDRLWHLERRLQAAGALRPNASPAPLAPRPRPSEAPLEAKRRLKLEVFPSLRSPYTYIAFERVLALPRRLPVDLVLRPVLPMVMRGLPVPRAKQLYILLDTKREAEDAGVPFGRMCDPVGRPVERALSLFPFARSQGRGPELLLSFLRAAFAEGIDTGSEPGLRSVVERAGLRWQEARRQLDGEGWREEIEANRRALFELGLWGVPSFRLLGEEGEPDFCTWGQDRIWRVEEEVRRRLA